TSSYPPTMMGSATFRRSPLGASPTTTARTRMRRRFGCLSEGRALAMPGRRDRAGLILRIDSWSMQLSFYFDDDCPVLRFAWLAHHFLILILRWCINSACCRGCHGVEPNRRGNRKSADVP